MSLISLGDLLRRKEAASDSYSDLEYNIEEAFAEQLDAAAQTVVAEDEAESSEISDGALVSDFAEAGAPIEQAAETLSSHAQNRMATFKVFDEANKTARDELARIGKAFTQIVTSYNLGRDFLDDCEQDIVRANELEQAATRLTIENRRLTERLEKLERARERQDDLIETMKRREARLIQDMDGVRENVAELRMELVEARSASSAVEAARSELHLNLAGRTADVERLQREVESFREKNAVLAMDFENVQKKHTESRRKLEELQSTQSAEAGRTSELSNKLTAQEKDLIRLQRQHDSAEAQLTESNEARRTVEQELREGERRHQSELQTLRLEIEQWKGRLQAVAATHLSEAARLRDEQPKGNEPAEVAVVERRRSRPRLIGQAAS